MPVSHAEFVAPLLDLLHEETCKPPRKSVDLRRMRVLAADDNATNRLVIEKMMRHFDIEFLTASDGQQALDMWQRHRPDLVLMDISMPVMDGTESARRIRAIEAAQNLPRTAIVAVTANAEEDAWKRVIDSELDDMIPKPVRRAKLVELLARFATPEMRYPLPLTDEEKGQSR